MEKIPENPNRQAQVISETRKRRYGAIFLMATSAIGPAFIVQTAAFTVQLGAAFAFVLIMSLVVDVAVQLNVWRVLCISGYRIQELASKIIPGAGLPVSIILVLGGFIFNIGNLSGAALGLRLLVGLPIDIAMLLSAAIALAIFLSKRAGIAMDRMVIVLGVLMTILLLAVTIISKPPVKNAMKQSILPDQFSFLAMTTIIGATIGGYVTYAGAHRLIDSGIVGKNYLTSIASSSILAILITGMVRLLLFLAVLGVTTASVDMINGNVAATAFKYVLGDFGTRVFGIILWAAGITSVIGASYTSVSFFETFSDRLTRNRNWLVAIFIAATSICLLLLRQPPEALLILAGALNGLILPFGFAVILWVAASRRDLLGGHRYSVLLIWLGFAAWCLTIYMGWNSIEGVMELWHS